MDDSTPLGSVRADNRSGSATIPSRFAPRLGRRLALAFAASVIVTAFVLAASSYLLVMWAQSEDARGRALSQARFNLAFAESTLPDSPTPEDYDRLRRQLSERGDFRPIIIGEGTPYTSGEPGVTPAILSRELRQSVERGRLSYQETELQGEPVLIVGGRLRSDGPDMYFIFPRTAEEATLARLRNVLMVTGLGLALLGSLLGLWLSRRILRPLAQARDAAGRMASGDLAARLPAGPGEFGELSAAFNRMAANLQAKVEALEAAQARERRFTSDVAHELRTPVAALVGEASLLQAQAHALEDGTLPAETRRAVELVVTDVDRLRRLIDDLLEISRIDARAAEVAYEQFEVGDFLGRLHAARGWPPEVELALPDRVVICTDRRRLERIITNLVENALKHGSPPVVVAAHRADSRMRQADLVLSVTDFGAGIAAHQRAHVFERFYKADASRGATKGSGLGLSIAWENARLLGGSLRVRSREGEGARFTLRVPIHPSPGDGEHDCGPETVTAEPLQMEPATPPWMPS